MKRVLSAIIALVLLLGCVEPMAVMAEPEAGAENEIATVAEEKNVEYGVYKLATALNESKVLVISNGSSAVGATTVLWNDANRSRQSVQIIPAEGNAGWYNIIVGYSGLALEVRDGSSANQGVVQQAVSDGSEKQLWRFQDAGNGYVYIQSKAGTYLDCKWGGSSNGTVIFMYESNKANSQKWKIKDAAGWVNEAGTAYLYVGSEKASGWQSVDGTERYYADGLAQTGFADIAGNTYYLDESGKATGWKTINGEDYYFDTTGAMLKNTHFDGVMIAPDGKVKYDLPAFDTAKTYYIGLLNNDVVISLKNGNDANGAGYELVKNTGAEAERFILEEAEPGWYYVKSAMTNKYVEIKDSSTVPGTVLQQNEFTGNDNQKWAFREIAEDTFTIKSKLGNCVDCKWGGKTEGTVIHSYTCNYSDAQKWTLKVADSASAYEEVKNGYYQLGANGAAGKGIVPAANGTGLTLQTVTDQDISKYEVTQLENGWYKIVNLSSKKALTLENNYNSAAVVLADYTGSNNQQWKFIEAKDGYYYIQARGGKVIDRKFGGTADGTIIQTYVLNGSAAQSWKLTDARCWVEKDGKLYLYKGSEPLTGLQVVDGKYYFLDQTGAVQVGFVSDDENTYYFDEKGMAIGWYTVEGKDYYFNEDGVLQKNTIVDGVKLGPDGSASYEFVGFDETKVYTFTALLSGNVVSVKDAGVDNGTTFELNKASLTEREQYRFVYAGSGCYYIINELSNKALEIKDASSADGAVLQLADQSGADNQLWQFIKADNGCIYIRSKLGTIIDCKWGGTTVGTVVHMYSLNYSDAQKWKVEVAEVPATLNIAEGTYQLTGYNTGDKVASLTSHSYNNAMAVTLQPMRYDSSEKYDIVPVEAGWYKIVNCYSGKVLEVAKYGDDNSVIIQQSDYTGAYNQQWRFVDAGNGYAVIQARTGAVMDRKWGGTTAGTVIHTYELNYSDAQKWKVEAPKQPKTYSFAVGDTYIIATALNTSRILDVDGATSADGANIQLYTDSCGINQQFKIESAGESGWYKIVNSKSGKVLTVESDSNTAGANVMQSEWMDLDSQKFRFIDAGNGYCYIQSKLETYLDCKWGGSANNTNIDVYSFNGSAAQQFRLDNISKANFVRATVISDTKTRVNIYNPSLKSGESLSFAIWSNAYDQDDLKYMTPGKYADGSYGVLVDSEVFNSPGTYTAHIYAKTSTAERCIATSSFTVLKKKAGWVYLNGYRRYLDGNGNVVNDVSNIFNPDQKYITIDRIKGITTIYGYNSQTGKYDTPIKAMWCSVGNPISLTPAGTHTTSWKMKSKEMNASDGSYRCWASYVTEIVGAVYFHGVASDTPDLNTVSSYAFNMLGTPQSHGCVRLAACDAKWIYDNVRLGTTVYVGDNLAAPITSPQRYAWVGGAVGPDPTYS